MALQFPRGLMQAGVERTLLMQTRLDIPKVKPAALQAMLSFEESVRKISNLEPSLLHLVRMRASQINGCANCLDMHSKEARAEGETEQRLYTLDAWEETPFFTDRERAALLWTEAVTRVSEDRVPDRVYDEVRQRFSEEELVNLTLTVVSINSWNRLCVSFRVVPGSYERKEPPTNATRA
jgi:AhpD family alkylhydroperoxidase